MRDQSWQGAGLHHDEQHGVRAAFPDRAPDRRAALHRRIGCVRIFFRHHAQHLVSRTEAVLHASHDVVAGTDLRFMHMLGMPERAEFLGDPVRPSAVGAGVADEDCGHLEKATRSAIRLCR